MASYADYDQTALDMAKAVFLMQGLISELKRQEKKKHKQEKPKGPTADLVEGTPVIYGLSDQKATDSAEEEESLKQTVKVWESTWPYEPRCEKTGLRDFRPGLTQT